MAHAGTPSTWPASRLSPRLADGLPRSHGYNVGHHVSNPARISGDADIGRGCPYRRVGVLLPDRGLGLLHPSRGDQDGLEVHDERAAVIVDGRADAFEQTVSDCWFEGGVIAP